MLKQGSKYYRVIWKDRKVSDNRRILTRVLLKLIDFGFSKLIVSNIENSKRPLSERWPSEKQ